MSDIDRADLITARLEGVRCTGRDRWVARCPAHKDRAPSLSIRALDDGRCLLHCFAGCPVDAVLSAIGLQMDDLFPPRHDGPGGGRQPEKRPFSVRDLIDALHAELGVAWVLLADLAADKPVTTAARRRAGVARDRCVALIDELRHVR